jgi:PKD repeat protein
MRRKLLLSTLLACLCLGPVSAQQKTQVSNNYFATEPAPADLGTARYAPGPVLNPQPLTGGCPTNDAVGSASNAFTNILTEANPIAVNNDINTIIFAHRNNAGALGGHSGQLRYDISTDGGGTWSNNQGVLNPLSVNGTNAARYPSVAIYNPAGNTVAANAYLAYYAPTVAATFNGTVSGVRRLNGAGNTETYNQPTATQTLIPRSMVKGAPGVFWAIDNVYNGTAVIGYRVLKGTWNGSTDVVWAVNTTINPTFNIGFDGTVKTSDYAIAFDPTGNTGWICMLTHVTPGPTAFALYPTFYKTTNGGTSWSGPITVDLSQFPCISANILTGNTATTAFDLDLTVDVHGNPHAFTTVANGDNAYAVFFGSWHAMVDITMADGVWNPMIVRNVYRGRGTWGTAPNTVSLDMEPQIARTADGTKIFYTWADADSLVVLATANQSPNLYAKAYDVVQRKWTNSYNMTACNVTWNGRIIFGKMAENVLSNTGNYKLPVVFSEFGSNDPINACNFHYLDSIWFSPSDFVNNQCTASVNIAAQDTMIICSPMVLDAGPGQFYAWNTGATTQTITASATGWYKVGKNDGCCTGMDSVYLILQSAPVSSYNSVVTGLTSTFTNTASGTITTTSWDFGDGQTSTQTNPTHTYALPGTYTVCLTVQNSCGTDSVCTSVTVTCNPAQTAWSSTATLLTANFTDLTVGNPLSWTWDFGDFNSSTLQNPTHTYTAAGTYNVCLTTIDSCGQDSVCRMVTVNCPGPVANFATVLPQWWLLDTLHLVDSSAGATSWLWDFGNGDTSSQQNPSYIYPFQGTYTICLTVTNSCGSDTTCQSIVVFFSSVAPGLAGEWSIAPNPARDLLMVAAKDAAAGNLRLRLTNTLGQTLLMRDRNHAGGLFQERLDLSTLADGIYYLEVRGETGRFVSKVVKR